MSWGVVEIPVHELHVSGNVCRNLWADDLLDLVEKMGVPTPRTQVEAAGAAGFDGENGRAHALAVLPGFTGGVDYPQWALAFPRRENCRAAKRASNYLGGLGIEWPADFKPVNAE